MKVTVELLTKLKACKHGFDLLKKYPNGATLIELSEDPDIELDDFYYARHYFLLNDEEMKIYNAKCHLEGCNEHVLRSSYVTKGLWIYNSTHIENCSYISNCENVVNSVEIVNSIDITDSKNVINSKIIKYSTNVADSDNIFNSENVLNSSYINWSKCINSSLLLDECQFCYKSRDCKDCYFCGFVEGGRHCIFCNNLSNAEYQIFNQPVTPAEFERVKEILLFQLQSENVDLMNIEPKRHLNSRFSYDLRFDRMFEQLSDTFYGWVGQLPQFNEQIFLLLFFTTLK